MVINGASSATSMMHSSMINKALYNSLMRFTRIIISSIIRIAYVVLLGVRSLQF